MLHSRLQLQSLSVPLKQQYTKLLLLFGKEIDSTSKTYQKHKGEPPIGRDLPPIAGRIAWARQLYRRIQEPMESFKNHPTILKDPDAKKVIKNFNKTSRVLVEFECLYYQAWSKQVKRGFRSSYIIFYIVYLTSYVIYFICYVIIYYCAYFQLKAGCTCKFSVKCVFVNRQCSIYLFVNT